MFGKRHFEKRLAKPFASIDRLRGEVFVPAEIPQREGLRVGARFEIVIARGEQNRVESAPSGASSRLAVGV